MKNVFLHSILIGVFYITSFAQEKVSEISLAGEWTVQLDSLDQGESTNWHSSEIKGTRITLPGTLDDAGIGTPNMLKPALNNYVLSNLTRKHQYIGKAWYQKEIEIPKSWKDHTISLNLERVLWKSKVFLDGNYVGSAESLIGSHEFDITQLSSPGIHRLTVVIDNSTIYPNINVEGNKYPDPINKDMAHAYTNHTQIKWNGILGDIKLEASQSNAPKDLQISSNFKKNTIEVAYRQGGKDKKNIIFIIEDHNNKEIYAQSVKNMVNETDFVKFSIPKPQDLLLWDEFHPNLYKAKIISGKEVVTTTFGFREIENDSAMLKLNGNRIFLRGNLECAIFPLTGHPPMKKKEWAVLISQAKSYGLNHLRFHSWCPPKAAFEAADEAGFYLQAELPHWSLKVGEDQKTTQFLKNEADKMLRDYGNHPSFIFMSLGNELQGDFTVLNDMVSDLKKKDKRRLYATTTFSFQRPAGTRPEPEDEFFVTQWTDQGWIRGQGIFNDSYPNFDKDYTANSKHIQLPLISHEIGQYSVYPDVKEISKYTGVLEPLNFIAIKNDLEKKGMLDLADHFTQASGKLAAMLYKEEIERALKTPSFDGFQLLQLQDFPGQGTALVGLLNAFWESKGIISAKEFREFNSQLVPLLRFEKAVYTNDETFKGTIEVANFFKEMKEKRITWSVTDEHDTIIARDTIEMANLILGNNQNIGTMEVPVQVKKAARWTIELSIPNTVFKNHWSIWVYPTSDVSAPEDMIITSSFEAAIRGVDQGKKVLLNPDPSDLKGIKGRFVPVFWSPVHFPDQPGTMGLLIDKEHQALQDFPTESHTEWHWWDLCIQSKSVIVDSLQVTPIVRPIDNFVTNHQLATIFEAKVGKGRLLFSSMDILNNLENRPVAKQLRKSIVNYMQSNAFNPSAIITPENLRSLRIKNDK